MQFCVSELHSCGKRARPLFFFLWGFLWVWVWVGSSFYGALVLFHDIYFWWLPLLVGTYSLLGILFVHNSF